MRRALDWITPAAFAFVALHGQALAQDALTDETFERWRDYVLPAPDELLWLEIPWRPTFWRGVRAAHEQRKPILLWAMNGHPLGCT